MTGLLFAAASLGMSLSIGSVDIPLGDVARHLFTDDGSVHDRIIDELRLPRSLSAFAVGGLLALAVAVVLNIVLFAGLLWLAAGGIGSAYYLVARLLPRHRESRPAVIVSSGSQLPKLSKDFCPA